MGFYGREPILAKVDDLLVVMPGSQAGIRSRPSLLIEGAAVPGAPNSSPRLAGVGRRALRWP